jgi:DNA-binding transcriptional MerR regulator
VVLDIGFTRRCRLEQPKEATVNKTAKTKPELESMLQDFRKLYSDPNTQGFTLLTCDNSESVAEVFLESVDGLNIGAFAELAGVSVDTVRHWVESEVLMPYSLNGKFKFMPPHLLELRSVQQWQGLGLTLEQIKERKAQGTTFVSTQPFKFGTEVMNGGVVQMVRRDDPRSQALMAMFEQSGAVQIDQQKLMQFEPNLVTNVKADFDAQIQKLEEQQQALEQKLANAKALRARLEPKH